MIHVRYIYHWFVNWNQINSWPNCWYDYRFQLGWFRNQQVMTIHIESTEFMKIQFNSPENIGLRPLPLHIKHVRPITIMRKIIQNISIFVSLFFLYLTAKSTLFDSSETWIWKVARNILCKSLTPRVVYVNDRFDFFSFVLFAVVYILLASTNLWDYGCKVGIFFSFGLDWIANQFAWICIVSLNLIISSMRSIVNVMLPTNLM